MATWMVISAIKIIKNKEQFTTRLLSLIVFTALLWPLFFTYISIRPIVVEKKITLPNILNIIILILLFLIFFTI